MDDDIEQIEQKLNKMLGDLEVLEIVANIIWGIIILLIIVGTFTLYNGIF